MRRFPRFPLLPFALVASALVIAAACEDPEAYVFTARRYDAAGRCVHASVAIEQVTGPGADANCRARCIRANDVLYVTTVCPPNPESARAVEATDPECAAALAVASIACDAPGDGGGEAGDDDAQDDDGGAAPRGDAGLADAERG